MVFAPLAAVSPSEAENRSSASQRSVSSSLSAARRSERSAGSQIGSQSTLASLQRMSIMKSRTWRTWFAASCAKSRRTSARSVSARPDAAPPTVCVPEAPGTGAGPSIDANPASRSSELRSRSKVSAIEACPLLTGPIISGAVGRTELRASPEAAPAALAGVAEAPAGGALAAGIPGAVGGPIEMAGIAGRLAPPEPGRAAASGRTGAPGAVAPTSMGRVTTTAGGGAGDAAGAGRGFAFGCEAAFEDCAPDCAPDVPLFGEGAWAAGIPRCVGFVDDGALFGACGFGCETPAPRPSFGGRCIDGPSSAVVTDAPSVSPFGAPEKSLEKTLIAEHQR